jgi:hypothetical protein
LNMPSAQSIWAIWESIFKQQNEFEAANGSGNARVSAAILRL